MLLESIVCENFIQVVAIDVSALFLILTPSASLMRSSLPRRTSSERGLKRNLAQREVMGSMMRET